MLFAVFLTVQFQYLFASHEVFKTFGLTYSQYVRKGFFELLVATEIGWVISYVIILKKRIIGKHSSIFMYLNVGLIVELILLLASALRRDLMYIEVYGLTRTRIIDELFLIWLLGGLMLLSVLNIWEKFQEKYVIAGMGAISIGILMYLNLFNMDMQIVAAAPIRHDQKDLFYITNLSEDAFDGWKEAIVYARERIEYFLPKSELTDDEQAQLANLKLALITLRLKRDKLERQYGPYEAVIDNYKKNNTWANDKDIRRYEKTLRKDRAWQAYNSTEYAAWKKIEQDNKLFTTEVDLLIRRIEDYQRINNIDLFAKEWWILRELEYPFVDTTDYFP